MPRQDQKWKPVIVFPLIGFATYLLSSNPFDSTRGKIGIGICGVLFVSYLAEEILRMTRNQRRRCSRCGTSTQVKSFRWTLRCAQCGQRD
jgi:hypothetical protein